MDIRGKMSGDVVAVIIKSNNSYDGKEALVDLEFGVRQEDAVARFGQDFADMAFSTLRVTEGEDDQADSYGFLVDSVKPNKRVVLGKHKIKIGQHTFDADPKIRGIKTAKDEPRVTVKLRLQVEVKKKDVLNYLQDHVGSELVTVEFEPAQGEFEFTAAKGTPAIDGTGAGAAAH